MSGSTASASHPSQLSPALLAESCGFQPSRLVVGAADPRLAVSLFVRHDACVFRPRFDADPSMHMLGVQVRPQWMVSRVDGRQTWRGTVPAMAVGLNRAGESGDAEVRGPLSRLMYFLPTRLLRHCAEQAGLATGAAGPELLNPRYQQDPEIAALSRQTLRALQDDSALSPLRLEALGQLLAVRLIERWSAAGPPRHPFPHGHAPAGIRRAADLLHARFADRLGIAELARAAGLSDHHFCRAFRATLGVSPHQFQLALRLDRAKALLKNSAMSVGDVAAAVGYDDPSHLGRLFRRELGMGPTAFRAQC